MLASTAHAAQPAVELQTAGSFAVLGGSTVTNTGPSVINGDLGVGPGTSITGFPPGVVNGAVHPADAVAIAAQSSVTTAYDDATGRVPAVPVPGNLGGLFLTAGVYRNASAVGLTGDVTLDARGDPSAVFVFQVGSSLTTASNSRVVLTGGAQACNVFWQIGSSATLGTATAFSGTILSQQSITLNTRATLHGRALARNGAVTLDTNTIDRADCAPGTTPPGALPGGSAPGTGPAGPSPAGSTVPAAGAAAFLTTNPRRVAQTVARYRTSRCVATGFRVGVSGVLIRRVNFLVDGHSIGVARKSPFQIVVRGRPGGVHKLIARVAFTDGSPLRNIGFRYRTCAPAARRVTPPPRFTG
jgi:hypothetical protein